MVWWTEYIFLKWKKVLCSILLALISIYICASKIVENVTPFAQVVCGKCSNQKYPLPSEDNKLSRVCRSCHQKLVQQKSASPEKNDTDTENNRTSITRARGLLEVRHCGWCSCADWNVTSIATHYGPDGSGIEFLWGRDFPHLYRPALGPTQPPIQWVLGLSRG
jgi:hypothetical protein